MSDVEGPDKITGGNVIKGRSLPAMGTDQQETSGTALQITLAPSSGDFFFCRDPPQHAS